MSAFFSREEIESAIDEVPQEKYDLFVHEMKNNPRLKKALEIFHSVDRYDKESVFASGIYVGYVLGREKNIDDFLNIETIGKLSKIFTKNITRNAADTRHSNKRTLYAMALETVKLDLNGNFNPEWTHADYVNYILNKEKFSDLSVNTLRNMIRNLFKESGLHSRIAVSAARYVKRNK